MFEIQLEQLTHMHGINLAGIFFILVASLVISVIAAVRPASCGSA